METLHYVLIGGVAALLLGKKKGPEPVPETQRVSTDSGLTLPALAQVQADAKKFECPTDKPGMKALKLKDLVQYKKCMQGTHLVSTADVVGPKFTNIPDKSVGCISVKQVPASMAKVMVEMLGWKLTGSISLGWGSLCPSDATPEMIAKSVRESE